MSYLATGDVGYKRDANGYCVDASGRQARSELCAPAGGLFAPLLEVFKPKPAAVAVVKPASLTKPSESWGDKLLKGLDIATKVSALNRPATAPPSPGMPSWVLPVALGGGALILVVALTRK